MVEPVQRDRDYHAAYYDLTTTGMDDIAFYARYVDPGSSVLELGCGTGRVSAALSERARRVVGVDRSEAMLKRAQEKRSGPRTTYVLDDITKVRLGERFDLIIAPFRVLQALERDAQVSAFFQTIKAHLAPGGEAILNVFHPNLEAHEMASGWVIEGENYGAEFALPGGESVTLSDERRQLDAERQVLYPVLIYRRYRAGVLIDEHRSPICMRYYYPEQFLALIEGHAFSVKARFGGYAGEPYGEGGELVVVFEDAHAGSPERA